MMAEDRAVLGFVAVVCTIGASALLAHGHEALCLLILGVGAFAWHVAIREVRP